MRLVFQWRPACSSVFLVALFLISQPAVAQITVASTSVNFGNVQVGGSFILPIAFTNTGRSSLTVSRVSVSGTGFSFAGPNLPITVGPQQTASLSVRFAPQAAGTATGSLTFSTYASWGTSVSWDGYRHRRSSTTVSLSGTGYTLTPTGYLNAPTSLNLGTAVVGTSQTQTLTLSNSGTSSLTISAATLTGTAFGVSSFSTPYTLGAGKSATLSVVFSPTAAGTAGATLTLASNATDPTVSVSLSGTGTSPPTNGTLAVTPATINFGNVNVGASQSQPGSVSASGASVTLSSAASSDPQFSVAGVALPVTIAAGQSVPFTVTYAPTAPGNAASTISFFGSGSTSTSEKVSGVGATIQHTVALSWNASTSTSVTGYNVYRSPAASGPYAKINPSLNASLNFSDGTVQSGQAYYYVTTAVDSTGTESTYSNQVQAKVPMP